VESLMRCNGDHAGILAQRSARAFLSDPLYKHIFPDAATREDLAAWEFGGIIRYGIRFGEVYAAVDLSGCAVWLPPGETDFAEERMAEIGLVDFPAPMEVASQGRLTRFIRESEEYHRSVAPDLHWYLVLLAVDPTRQGQGIGNALLRGGLDKADAGGHLVYLEATSHDNVPFYRRRGFEVRTEAFLTDGGPCIWYMVRDPRP
jgi:ribosomal protein S18 acetylase RimI-like enzyme